MTFLNLPQTDKGQKTLESLVEAAKQNFYTKGFYNTTIKDITQAAGVSVGTFYIYFPDKMAVYEYVVMQYGDYVRKEIGKRIHDVKNRKEAEKYGLIAYIEIARDNPDIYTLIWEAISVNKELCFHYYEKFAQDYIYHLEKAMDRQEIHIKNPETAAYVFMGINTYLGVKYGIIDKDADLEAIADEVIGYLSGGMFD